MGSRPVEQIFYAGAMVAFGAGLLFFGFSRPIKGLASDVK